MNNLTLRILTSIVYVIVLLGSIIINEYASSLLFLTIIVLCLNEFYGFFKDSEIKPQRNIGIIAGSGFFIITVLSSIIDLNNNSLFLLVPTIFLIFVVELYRNRPNPIPNIGYTLLGIIYIAVPFTLLHELAYFKELSFGNEYSYDIIIGYFFVLWANDSMAYFVGKNLGKNKLFPRISPKKTWEGSIGGALSGLLVGYLNFLIFPETPLVLWLGIAAITVIFGSLGDLVESLFKRSLNIKDSGTLLPGHGGVLDRFDGIFISAPMVYTFLRLVSIW